MPSKRCKQKVNFCIHLFILALCACDDMRSSVRVVVKKESLQWRWQLAYPQLLRGIVCVEVKSAQISATTDRTPRFCKFSSFLKIYFKHSEIDKSMEFSIIE